MASETPISTQVTVISQRDDISYHVSLPNQKEIVAHLSKVLRNQVPPCIFAIGDQLEVEMTPYDFSKARIVSLANTTR